MGRDLAEEERAFVEGLAADTGRDLASWMRAISESSHNRRNDIIDWLRQQGFAFSKASWLERIHHNSGQLIYGGIDVRGPGITDQDVPARTSSATPEGQATATKAALPEPQSPVLASLVQSPPEKAPAGPAAPRAALPGASDEDIAALLAAAKGLRPLAGLILREMEAQIPGLACQTASPHLLIACPLPFSALLPAPKEIRLYGDFGPAARDRARKADSARPAAHAYPDMLVLNDARQIDERFRELVAQAYTRALT